MIKLLDCTLRDGGYINNWEFGEDAICDIKEKLEESSVDIIELGFIKNEPENKDRTVFNNIEQAKKLIGKKQPGKEYAVMAEVVNPLPLEMLAPYDEDSPEIIRVIVWKRMLKEGFEYCKGIVEKGYKLCVQPARVSQYTDEEFIEMIRMFNELNPLAIYVVDSWGTMYKEELIHYLKLADEHIKEGVGVGYHGHNNMMQAFEVACAFAQEPLKRDLIIDASVYGIGRGAGNLNTELFAKWANQYLNKSYSIEPLVSIYDNYISAIYDTYEKWGYSIPFFITAKYNANPNFANFYMKRGVSNEIIEKCIASMTEDERIIFKEELAKEKLNTLKTTEINKNQKEIIQRIKNRQNLAILLITANREAAVKGFLLGCANKFNKLNIDIIVYDSSDNNKTENIVDKFTKIYPNVKYDRWEGKYDGVSIDDKVIDAYKKYSSMYKYLWATRDGLCITIESFINNLSFLMGLDKEIIIIDSIFRDYKNHGSKDYTEPALLFKEQCAHMNTLGTFIVKSDFILKVINHVPLDRKTYGMYFPMAFFYYYEDKTPYVSSLVCFLWKKNRGAVSSSFWTKKILWQWGERWFNMIDNLPAIYNEYKSEVMKIETVDFKPFSFPYLAKARYHGGLTFSLINKYKKFIPFVCDTPLWQFYLLASLPKYVAKKLGKIVSKKLSKINQRKQKIRIKYISKVRKQKQNEG